MHADTSPEAVRPYDNCEQVVYDDYVKTLGPHQAFTCYDVKKNMDYLSSMVITSSKLHMLRLMPRKKGYAYVVYSKPLCEISMITAKTNNPEVITITYGNPTSDEPGASSSDRFFIPDADAAVGLLNRILERIKSVAAARRAKKLNALKSAETDSSEKLSNSDTTDNCVKKVSDQVDEDVCSQSEVTDNENNLAESTRESAAESVDSKDDNATEDSAKADCEVEEKLAEDLGGTIEEQIEKRSDVEEEAMSFVDKLKSLAKDSSDNSSVDSSAEVKSKLTEDSKMADLFFKEEMLCDFSTDTSPNQEIKDVKSSNE